MPLVKSGKIVEDRYVRVADGEPVPEQGAVIVSADRFLADAEELASAQRSGRRDLAEQSQHRRTRAAPADKLALVALVFPAYKDGRAYSQARLLRERYRFRGELRATGQVLRDQFLFLVRAGFDTFDVVKPADALSVRGSDAPLQRVLPADRRRPCHGGACAQRRAMRKSRSGNAERLTA